MATPPNLEDGHPLPGFCVMCRRVQARTFIIESSGKRLCDSHVRIVLRELLQKK